MAYKRALLLLAPLVLAGCSSLDSSAGSGQRSLNSPAEEGFIRSPYPDPYYNKEYLSDDQRREISEHLRAQRLEARGRRDNSTDSGDGFGQTIPNGYFD
jgi:hypothetical protein